MSPRSSSPAPFASGAPARLDEPLPHPAAWVRECLRADFERNTRLSARVTLVCLRLGRAWHRQPGARAWLLRRLIQVAQIVWVEGVIGSEIPNSVYIGPGVRIPHSLRGVMIHPSVAIGSRCTVYHQTVFGVRDERGGPRVGDGVEIGVGARILGPIRVGDGCRIGANAVVVKDTEPGGTYVGVPASRAVSRRDH